MQDIDTARDSADAVRRFAAELRAQGQRPDRIQARLDAKDGVAGLCAAEAAIAEQWPPATAKELVWLAGSGDDGDLLHLQARAADGELLCAVTFRLGYLPRAAAGGGPRAERSEERGVEGASLAHDVEIPAA